MKFVATADFRAGGKHVAKGEIVEYDDEKVIGQMRAAGRIAEPGSPEALKAKTEVAEERKREKRAKREPWTRAHKLQAAAIMVALIGILYGLYRASHQLTTTRSAPPPPSGRP